MTVIILRSVHTVIRRSFFFFIYSFIRGEKTGTADTRSRLDVTDIIYITERIGDEKTVPNDESTGLTQ